MFNFRNGGLIGSDAIQEIREADPATTDASPPVYVLDAEAAGAIAYEAMRNGPLAVVDTALAALYYANSPDAAQMQAFIDTVVQYDKAISADGKSVLIDASAADGDGAALLAQLQALGLQNGSSFRGAVSGYLPINSIGALTNAEGLAMARQSVMITDVGSVTTQADRSMAVDTARSTYGVTGAGVKIGVLSDSFNKANVIINGQRDDFARNVESGDLLATTKVLDELPGAGSDEGRGMAQLVQDLAPGADITFATAFTGQAGFANNIIALAKAGNKVIVDDVRYYTELMYQNGPIAQAVNQVVREDGAVYFSSAGNQAAQGWQGDFVPGGTYVRNGVTYQLLSFGVATTLPTTPPEPGAQDYLRINSSNGLLAVQWDQPSVIAGGPGSQVNVDVFVSSDPAGATVTAQAISNNIGNDAVEFIGFGSSATRYIRIGVPVGTTPPGNVRLVISTGTVQNTTTNQNPGSGFGHSVAELGIGVGAVPYYGTPIDNRTAFTGTIPVPLHENFSSRGTATLVFDDNGVRRTTPIVRTAALLSAVDGGNTTFFSSDDTVDTDNIPNFYGTSAAAPDLAAVAVLMRQVDPTLTQADILAYMSAVAIDMDDRFTTGYDAGFDSRTGAGFVQADNVLRALITKVIDNPSQPILTGTRFSETIRAGAANNTVFGADGNDQVYGNAGTDTLYGNAGDDSLFGNTDNDTLYGDSGNDMLAGGQGDDVIYGGSGDDFIEGGLGNDLVNGGTGFNTATYAFATGAVTVTLGNPVGNLTGVGTTSGAAGVDTLVNIQNVLGGNFDDVITGDTANNTLTGNAGNDTLGGGAGNDLIDGGDGDDLMDGGAGVDTVTYALATSGVTVDLALTTQQATGGSGADTLNGFEAVIGSAFNDTLRVADGGIARGGEGGDVLYGPAPSPTTVDQPDYVKPSTQANTSRATAVDLTGFYDRVNNPNIIASRTVPHATVSATVTGAGTIEYYAVTLAAGSRLIIDIDRYTSTTDSVVQLQDAAGTVLVENDDGPAGDPGDTTSNNSLIDVVVNVAGTYYIAVGGYQPAAPIFTTNPAGTSYLLHISASGQAVTLDGGFESGGNATLLGEGGNDTLFSGLGDDVLNGGDGVDSVSYALASAGVTVNLSNPAAQATGGAGLDTISGVENLTGSNFADNLTGDDNANSLFGGIGADSLTGGFGADVLYGNQDNDVLYGNQGADVIYGGQGDDVIYGGNDADILFGNAGADILYGNIGADTFTYATVNDSTATVFDTIFGFERGIDRVDLRPAIAGQAYTSGITYAAGVATISVDLTANGAGADIVIRVLGTGTTPITAADILFT